MSTLTEKFVSTCLDYADQEAMRVRTPTGWVVYKHKELLVNARRIAAWLRGQGLVKDEKVAVILDNCPQWCMVYFGILLAGGVVVPLDPQASRQDIVTFADDAGVSFVFMENRLVDALQHHLRIIKKIIVLKNEKTTEHCLSIDEIVGSFNIKEAGLDVKADSADTASIIYSSGTTSNPKGVELTHKNLFANFRSLEDVKICTSEDHFISILPLFHAYSFMATLIYPLFIGARITYPKTIKSSELVQIMKDAGITVTVGVPEIFNSIHKSISDKINDLPLTKKLLIKFITEAAWRLRGWTGINLSKLIYHAVHERFGHRLRYLVSGGARLEPRIGWDFEKFGFTIIEGYGLTETSPIVTLNPPGRIKIGSVGKAVTGVEIKIINPGADGVGEIAVRGTNVMKGYYKKPEETDAVIKDGWFYTGDLGLIDPQGYVYISGRVKEVIVLGSGKNIFPEEIEKYYARSKFVKEVGVFLSEQEHTHSLRAVVVPNFDAFKKGRQINIEERIRWDIENISKDLSGYKRIMGFVLSKEELPKTRLGKIKRYQLPTVYLREAGKEAEPTASASLPGDDFLLKDPLGCRIASFLKKELGLKRDVIGRDHLELDLGVDSLSRVELVAGLEQLFQIRLSDQVLQEVATVTDLVTQVDYAIKSDIAGGSVRGEGAQDSLKTSWREILNFDINDKQFENVELNPPPPSRFIGYFSKIFFFIIFKMFCRLKIIHRERLPERGPYIICCNHASFLDAFVVIAGISDKVADGIYFIGLKDIFDHPMIRWSTRLGRVITIDPATDLVKAMQAASLVLRNDKILCIFPEGQRSIDGEVKRFKKGIGILAKELGVNIVPAAINGAFESWPRMAKFPKPHPIQVVFGMPMNYRGTASNNSGEDDYRGIADKIREDVVRLKASIHKTV